MKRAVLFFPTFPSRQAQYPTGLFKIATYCSEHFNVTVIDERVEHNALQHAMDIARTDPDLLCVGVSVMTGEQIRSAVHASRQLHAHTKVVWGGPHPTALPLACLRDSFVDYVVPGEGEQAFLDLLSYLEGRGPKTHSFASKGDAEPVYNYLPNLRARPYVDFLRYPIDPEYFLRRDGFHRAFTLETSRGCPHQCAFCHNSAHRTGYRFLEAPAVLDLISYLCSNYAIDGVVFQEDNLFANHRRARAIVSGLLPFRIGWKANSRVDYFRRFLRDRPFMNELVKSGCKVLQFGVESGSPRILRLVSKGLRVADALQVNRALADYPLRIRYNFIVGFPSETPDEIDQTIALSERLRRDNPYVDPPFLNIYTPYPGTPLYSVAREFGFLPPDSTEGWIRLNWNSALAPWLSAATRDRLDQLSASYYDRSPYLRDSGCTE